jgi:hypothetical protein
MGGSGGGSFVPRVGFISVPLPVPDPELDPPPESELESEPESDPEPESTRAASAFVLSGCPAPESIGDAGSVVSLLAIRFLLVAPDSRRPAKIEEHALCHSFGKT